MKTITIDEDVALAILKHTSFVGETESEILRRLLGLKEEVSSGALLSGAASSLKAFLHSPEFEFSRGAVGRFLAVLGYLYQHHPEDFDRVLNIRGRDRLYFSREQKFLEDAGTSVNPKQIPGTPHWVITNTSTAMKQSILKEVMRSLGYSGSEASEAVDAIAS